MEQNIIGFHQDEAQDWVADLACGHRQHVRHEPPWSNRPWVLTQEGRRAHLGQTLPCKTCAEMQCVALPTVSLYDSIGAGYDSTRRADPYLAARLTHHLALVPDGHYLDLACGTGNYTTVMAAQAGRWIGVDSSAHMLQMARHKGAPVLWHQADASALPFTAGCFQGILCTLAIHHFPALFAVLREARRVLQQGHLVVFTSTAEQMHGYWLNAYFPEAMARSIVQMPTLHSLLMTFTEAGWRLVARELYAVQPDVQDGFLYSAKHHPERYLSANFRRGISTFANLADPEEVRTGCQRLQDDLQTGRLEQVMASYQNNDGDYVFLVATPY